MSIQAHETAPGTVLPTFERGLRLSLSHQILPEWEAAATAARRARTSGNPIGPVTGLPRLDQALGGALPPGLNILLGQPGAGKTALALQVAASCLCPALFVSCEMTRLELMRRLIARATRTPLGRLKTGELSEEEAREIGKRAAASAPRLGFIDATQQFPEPVWLRDAALAVRGEADHLLIVLDSIHAWADTAPGEGSEYERLNEAMVALRALAVELTCPVLAVGERNRSSMANGGLSAGAGSRKLEYGSETVLDLCRDEKARLDASGEVRVSLILQKNRHGAPGQIVPLSFNGGLQRFRQVVR